MNEKIHYLLLSAYLPLCYTLNINVPPSITAKDRTIFDQPHVGYVVNQSDLYEAFVIGTSHLQCNSSHEVTSLIEQVQPDAVVLELDPERVLRLTKQYAGFDEYGKVIDAKSIENTLYGADFLAAVNSCQQFDIPIFLGDEYAQDTKRRLAEQMFNWREAYSPAPLVNSILAARGDEAEKNVRLNLLQSFVDDPKKLMPILVSSVPPFFVASALAYLDGTATAFDGSLVTSSLETVASIVVSFLACCFLFNSVIADRDKILASNTVNAVKVIRSLRQRKSIRKRWSFAVNQQEMHSDDTSIINLPDSVPIFTLKTPLFHGAIRHLNLFEPRWLKMIDKVSSHSASSNDVKFGCVRCTNKFYSAVSVNGMEGRYADVIFDKEGSFAIIKQLKEGKRSMSGDRKISVTIQGDDAFLVNETSLSVSDDGYMVAADLKPIDVGEEVDHFPQASEEECTDVIRIVVVAGLLHGNGVIDLLSKE